MRWNLYQARDRAKREAAYLEHCRGSLLAAMQFLDAIRLRS